MLTDENNFYKWKKRLTLFLAGKRFKDNEILSELQNSKMIIANGKIRKKLQYCDNLDQAMTLLSHLLTNHLKRLRKGSLSKAFYQILVGNF